MTTPTIEQQSPPETPPPKTEQVAPKAEGAAGHLTRSEIWRELRRSSFAVLSHVSHRGEPRSSGVVYGVAGKRLYVAVAPNSWKARQLVSGQRVSVTVPIRKGGILSLLLPIPPATVTFQAKVSVFPSGTLDLATISPSLTKLLPDERKSQAVILELQPVGNFLTFGIGTSLMDMRKPELARARIPVA